ncbi:MAG UNVERIFIED_CONTAM: hypothetical protein LVR29_34445 [Microcystis novacekii LVE1205-3]
MGKWEDGEIGEFQLIPQHPNTQPLKPQHPNTPTPNTQHPNTQPQNPSQINNRQIIKQIFRNIDKIRN